jgi:hypothetical protein
MPISARPPFRFSFAVSHNNGVYPAALRRDYRVEARRTIRKLDTVERKRDVSATTSVDTELLYSILYLPMFRNETLPFSINIAMLEICALSFEQRRRVYSLIAKR